MVSTYSDHSFTRRRPTGCLRTWVCVIGRAATYSSSRQLVAHPTKVSQMGNIGEAVRASTERCHNIERKPYGCRGRAPRPRRWIQGHHCAARRPETPCESFLDYDFAPRCFLHRPPRAAASALMKKWSLHTITSRHSVPPPLNFVGRSTMGPRRAARPRNSLQAWRNPRPRTKHPPEAPPDVNFGLYMIPNRYIDLGNGKRTPVFGLDAKGLASPLHARKRLFRGAIKKNCPLVFSQDASRPAL